VLITGVSVRSRTDVKYGRTWKREAGGETYITMIKENSFEEIEVDYRTLVSHSTSC